MSFGLNPAEYSLYAIDGKDPLPPDTPLNLRRGERFEAQKDGRYGASAATANGHFTEWRASTPLHSEQGQLYVEIGRLTVPSPPRSAPNARILVAVPATYPISGLDAFYIHESLSHAPFRIPRTLFGYAVRDGDSSPGTTP